MLVKFLLKIYFSSKSRIRAQNRICPCGWRYENNKVFQYIWQLWLAISTFEKMWSNLGWPSVPKTVEVFSYSTHTATKNNPFYWGSYLIKLEKLGRSYSKQTFTVRCGTSESANFCYILSIGCDAFPRKISRWHEDDKLEKWSRQRSRDRAEWNTDDAETLIFEGADRCMSSRSSLTNVKAIQVCGYFTFYSQSWRERVQSHTYSKYSWSESI